MVPGPAISELGALGIPIQIKEGKIEIKESKIIAKKGEKIKQNAADMMNKLGIKPFEIGFIPIAGFDLKNGKLYSDIKIDRKGTLEKLKSAYGKALPFAVEIGYPSKDTIKFLIGKAGRHGRALEKLGNNVGRKEVKEKNSDDKTNSKYKRSLVKNEKP